MVSFKSSLLALLVLSFIASSCGKKGCTNSDAINYSASAKNDDGTCQFEGSLIFWLADSSAQKMQNDGIQSLTVYFEGDIVGTVNVNESFASAPDCGQAGGVTVKRDLFSVRNRAFTFRILDDQSVKRWAGTVEFVGNSCQNFEMVYFP